MGSYICLALVSSIIMTCQKSVNVPTPSLGSLSRVLEPVLNCIQAQLSRTDGG